MILKEELAMTKAIMSRKRKQSLRKLAKLMNTRHRRPWPVTSPLLACFDVAVNQQEVDFLLRFGIEPHNYSEAEALSSQSKDTFKAFFDKLIHKGFICKEHESGKEPEYLLAGIAFGWFEVIFADGKRTAEQKKLAVRGKELLESYQKFNIFPLRNLMNFKEKKLKPSQSVIAFRDESKTRTATRIEVNRMLKTPEPAVYPSSKITDLFEKHAKDNSIAVIHCGCRELEDMAGNQCRFDFPTETCILMGNFAKYMVDYGVGRYITKDEALRIIETLRQKGAIHQIFHEEEDLSRSEFGFCSCCWDCCGILGSYNRGILPLNFKTFYLAQIADESLCDGCGTCENHCPVQAITVNNGKSQIDVDKCIGCGQCEFQCPNNVITLIAQEREVMLPLQKRSEARIQA
jgi:NAD-dependent dihydropyrimidine dehydrogenase PreA subunit